MLWRGIAASQTIQNEAFNGFREQHRLILHGSRYLEYLRVSAYDVQGVNVAAGCA
jgi:hypothetical protein